MRMLQNYPKAYARILFFIKHGQKRVVYFLQMKKQYSFKIRFIH